MAAVGGSGTGSGTRPGGPVTRTDGSVRPATGDLQALCLGFVEQLKDEALHVLLSREAGLLALLPEQAAGLDDRGRGRLLAKVFAKVTVSDDPTLLQARDLLGLSASDPGIEDRLVRLAATDASTDPRNTTTRLGLAASVTGKSVRTVRRHAGAILRRLLEATQDFMEDDGLVQELMDELWTRDEGVAEPLDGPGVRRVLRLCGQFAGELDQVFDTVHGATSFSTGLYVARGVQQDLLDRLDDPEAVVAVIGEAGYGKTSLLWGLHRELSRGLAGGSSGARFSHPLLVNAAWLQMPGRAAILPGEDLVRAVTALADRGADPVVLLDTLDLLLHDKDESVRAIDLVWELRGAGARVVVSCREQEANAAWTTAFRS